MHWSPRQARNTLLLFLLLLALGQVWAWWARPVYPDTEISTIDWPPAGHLVDATVLGNRGVEAYPEGTTAADAMTELGVEPDPLGSGFCLPRAGILYNSSSGWRIRPMTQRERWVWRIPMDLNRCKPHDLQRIDGIGPSLARRIYRFVQERGYLDSLSQLDEVKGIGSKKLKALKKELEIP